ncbi:unnamed protein product, partial [Symbiodinium necroappetens]
VSTGPRSSWNHELARRSSEDSSMASARTDGRCHLAWPKSWPRCPAFTPSRSSSANCKRSHRSTSSMVWWYCACQRTSLLASAGGRDLSRTISRRNSIGWRSSLAIEIGCRWWNQAPLPQRAAVLT